MDERVLLRLGAVYCRVHATLQQALSGGVSAVSEGG
jgi:hypothetical protein